MASKTLVDTDSSQTVENKTCSTDCIWQGDPVTYAYGGHGLSTLPSSGQVLVGTGSGYALVSTSGLLTGTSNGISVPYEFSGIWNHGLTASYNRNLTVKLLESAGSDPSASSPVVWAIRHTSSNNGTFSALSISAAESVTILEGSTFSATTNQILRLYAGLANNAGTGKLCVWSPLAGTATSNQSLFKVDESTLYSTTALTASANSGGVIYSTSALTDVYIKPIGYFDIAVGSPVGTFTSNATKIQLLGPGVARTGDLVQRRYGADTLFSAGTGTIPQDNTVPLVTEGNQYMSLAITPTSAQNRLLIEHIAGYTESTNVGGTVALFQNSTCHAATVLTQTGGANGMSPGVLRHEMSAGTTNSTTFAIRAGLQSAGTLTFNGKSAANLYGGRASASFKIDEICL